jgi:hypothetical protein
MGKSMWIRAEEPRSPRSNASFRVLEMSKPCAPEVRAARSTCVCLSVCVCECVCVCVCVCVGGCIERQRDRETERLTETERETDRRWARPSKAAVWARGGVWLRYVCVCVYVCVFVRVGGRGVCVRGGVCTYIHTYRSQTPPRAHAAGSFLGQRAGLGRTLGAVQHGGRGRYPSNPVCGPHKCCCAFQHGCLRAMRAQEDGEANQRGARQHCRRCRRR